MMPVQNTILGLCIATGSLSKTHDNAKCLRDLQVDRHLRRTHFFYVTVEAPRF